MTTNKDHIVLGGGCFWCLEAVFQGFRGVEKVESGYAGGRMVNPDYESVSAGSTEHAEVVRIWFDPGTITLKQILTIFFHAHDPTTKDRQGNDVGSQYRSIVLYQNDEQKRTAQEVQDQIVREHVWGDKSIVTEIEPLKDFYRAEEYHQNYFKNNPDKGYCAIVIAPKVQKIRHEFEALLKDH